jgi:superoxide dismutase, Fe-Mn family
MKNKVLFPVRFLLISGLLAFSFFVNSSFTERAEESKGFSLTNLSYGYDALEPYIDSKTMEIHHTRHHAAYVNNLNRALEGNPALHEPIEAIMARISEFPVSVRNNGGGHYNHDLFWNILSPNGGGDPTGKLAEAIRTDFGSLEQMKDEMNRAAMGRFGSGWAWLIVKDGKLMVTSTPNQDNPLMDIAEVKGIPIIGIDVWEHAYYLKYQNKRGDYLSAFWEVVNWDAVAERYQAAQ